MARHQLRHLEALKNDPLTDGLLVQGGANIGDSFSDTENG